MHAPFLQGFPVPQEMDLDPTVSLVQKYSFTSKFALHESEKSVPLNRTIPKRVGFCPKSESEHKSLF